MQGICALCGKYSDLQSSHIAPKFIFRWLIKTSATGFLRSSKYPNLRVKDGIKIRLLCRSCEGIFSKYESYFASEIFNPHMLDPSASIKYDSRLRNFVVSISFRSIHLFINDIKDSNFLKRELESALTYWRKCLLNYQLDNRYQHHVLPLDYIIDAGDEPPRNLNYYLMRSVHWDILRGDGKIYVYTKIPGFIIISCIYPRRDDDFSLSRVFKFGTLPGNEHTYCIPKGIMEYIRSKSDSIIDLEISPRQRKLSSSEFKLARESRPEDYYNSGTVMAHWYDDNLR